MSTLLATASPWINEDTKSSSKKRASTMRKQISNEAEYDSTENMQNVEPTTIEQSQTINESRNTKVNDLLNQMSHVSPDNDGSKLANFNPPPAPVLNHKKPELAKTSDMELKPHDLLPKHPLYPNPVYPTNNSGERGYKANESNLGVYNNYKSSYEPSNIQLKPYYAKMGISSTGAVPDDKIMEKINYMIHMLEEQQHEKTNSVTEEFILYTFLGVFMIFIVDSFARAGKYVR